MRAVMNVVMYILSTGWQPVPFVLGPCHSGRLSARRRPEHPRTRVETTMLVADDALSSVIVLRTKNKDCLAIDFSNAPCRRWLPGPSFNEIAEPPHFLGPEDARGVPSFARAFVHRREDAVQEA
jgi:hypothetical protein